MWHIAAGQVNSSHYAIHEAARENPALWFSPCGICKPSIPKHRLTSFLRRLHPSLSFSDPTALLITSLHKLDRLIIIFWSSQLYRTEKTDTFFKSDTFDRQTDSMFYFENYLFLSQGLPCIMVQSATIEEGLSKQQQQQQQPVSFPVTVVFDGFDMQGCCTFVKEKHVLLCAETF